MASDSILNMNESDPEQSKIITKQNEEITYLQIEIRVWNTPHFKIAEKLMTENCNNTASPSE